MEVKLFPSEVVNRSTEETVNKDPLKCKECQVRFEGDLKWEVWKRVNQVRSDSRGISTERFERGCIMSPGTVCQAQDLCMKRHSKIILFTFKFKIDLSISNQLIYQDTLNSGYEVYRE